MVYQEGMNVLLTPNDRDNIIASGAGDDAIRLFVDSNNDCKKNFT